MEIHGKVRPSKPSRPEERRFKTVEELGKFKNDQLMEILKNIDLSALKRDNTK